MHWARIIHCLELCLQQVACRSFILQHGYDTSYTTLARRAAKTNNFWNRLVRRGSVGRRVFLYGMWWENVWYEGDHAESAYYLFRLPVFCHLQLLLSTHLLQVQANRSMFLTFTHFGSHLKIYVLKMWHVFEQVLLFSGLIQATYTAGVLLFFFPTYHFFYLATFWQVRDFVQYSTFVPIIVYAGFFAWVCLGQEFILELLICRQ